MQERYEEFYLVSSLVQQESQISNLPIIETIISILERFQDDKDIILLCCNAIIVYSMFGRSSQGFLRIDCVVNQAKEFGLIEKILDGIQQTTDERIIALKLGVVAALGSNGI